MDDILIKPVNLVDLMGRVDQWLPLPAGTELPAPAQGGGADVLDRSVLDAITGGDPGVERDVLLDLRQVNEADMGLLRQSLHGTRPGAGHAGRRLRGGEGGFRPAGGGDGRPARAHPQPHRAGARRRRRVKDQARFTENCSGQG